jgi:hypothetical protein
MLTSTPKRFILPFSNPRSGSAEVEAAAVFASAEFERSRGGGLIVRQPEEKLVCLSKVGYPLWLIPKNDLIYMFDGLNDSNQPINFLEAPSAKVFLESLDANSKPRENYSAFLLDHANYFQKSTKQKQFQIKSLIVNPEFKSEFLVYRKEAAESIAQTNMAYLSPIIEENALASMLSDFEKIQGAQKEDSLKLPECIRLINKTTGQYITELDYAAQAATEEMDAKIKALEEFVNPQVAKLNKEYRAKKQKLSDSFDLELDNLQKQRVRTQKSIQSNEEKIRGLEREAKAHAAKHHEVYEKRCKEKAKQGQREVKELQKTLSAIEDNFKKLGKQKTLELSKLNFELDSEIKLARQPLRDLEAAREAKTRVFKSEAEKLYRLEKPVLEDLNRSQMLRETYKATFESLGFKDPTLKTSSLFYVPFYAVCYQAGLTRRYRMFAPSTVRTFDFSAKLKGTFGRPKTKDLLDPRFKTVTSLIVKVEELAKQNSLFESRLYDLTQRNNLLNNSTFRDNVVKGLSVLSREGWFSDKEQQTLSSRLVK